MTWGIFRIVLGFGFKVLGLVGSLTDVLICDALCAGQCTLTENSSCSLRLLFVGIIFIIVGYALVTMQKVNIKQKLKEVL